MGNALGSLRPGTGEPDAQTLVEDVEALRGSAEPGESLERHEATDAEDVVERDRPARKLVEREAEQRRCPGRREADLHPVGPSGVLGRDRVIVEAGDERGHARGLTARLRRIADPPFRAEAENDDDIGARALDASN